MNYKNDKTQVLIQLLAFAGVSLPLKQISLMEDISLKVWENDPPFSLGGLLEQIKICLY